MTRLLTLLVLVVALAATACSESGDTGAATTTAPPSSTTTTAAAPATSTTTTVDETMLPAPPPLDYAGFRLQPTACGATAPPEPTSASYTAPADAAIAADTQPQAIIDTSCGRIVIALDPLGAPEAVNSFAFLADEGYFDGTVIHRIVPAFVIQGGDPTATGRGNPGYAIADEPPRTDSGYVKGTVAMANAGPGTTGSQFFIMLEDVPLPPSYTVIGSVIEGLDVIAAIAAVPVVAGPTGEVSSPTETVYLDRVVVER